MLFESEEDEIILVATIVSYTNTDPELTDRIDAACFTGVRATIWETARHLRSSGKSITKRAIAAAHSDNQTVAATLEQLSGRSWPSTRVVEAERTVLELRQFRLLQGALTAAQEHLVAETYSEALEAAHSELSRLEDASHTGSDITEFEDVVQQWQTNLSERPPHSQPVPTPWEHVDDKLAGGLHRGRTYVIGARPGEGKSVAGVNLATYAAQTGHPTLIFSVEMGTLEVASRIIAGGAHADYGQITRKDVDDYNWDRIAGWLDTHHQMPLGLIDKTDIGVEYVAARCRARKRTHGLDVVFVDYLQLLRPGSSREARERQIAEMSRTLKVLAQELNIAVIIACQLNRNSANEKRAPQLSDLRESGSIEQDCDVAMLLHHIKLDDGMHSGDVDLVIAKNRTGAVGTVRLGWKAYQARLA
ncbi:replicative DNA helicase [Gordonia sp. SND2]|uniref:replicative DNA helicase n=1 Tax=Gordonia sp. SND2 TaxID=3388659 RepID=UPI00398B97A2